MVCTICCKPVVSEKTVNSACSAGKAQEVDSIKALICGHMFHAKCIQAKFTSSGNTVCPICYYKHAGAQLNVAISVTDPNNPNGQPANPYGGVDMERVCQLEIELATQKIRAEKLQIAASKAQQSIAAAKGEANMSVSGIQMEINRLLKRDEAHRSHIRSLQSNLEEHREILDEYGYYDD
ncbi:hypothetical protein EV183_001017 [Coemansia sp. RSA 2336]|nr:hypothetical protein EV183_001017 [Coemansia sp. RSA 2336]